MQSSSPPSKPASPQKPSRIRLLQGALSLLVLIALLAFPLVRRSSPLGVRLREALQGIFIPLSPSMAQQSSPTATLPGEILIQTASPLPSIASSPTVPNIHATQTVSSSPTIFGPSFWGSGWIILSLLDRDFYHLFAYQPASQQWLQLTDGEGDDLHPAVSPDGRWIAFASNRQRYWNLYLLSLQDGNVLPLTSSPHYDGAPTWSPDGKWVAYESYLIDLQTGQGNLEILIQEVNPSGGQNPQVLQLTSSKGADFAPQWSPRGRQIAFISQRAAENDLWIADLDRIDDRYRNLSRYTSSSVQSLGWSADGRWLVWNAADEGVQWVYRWDADSPESPPRKVVPGSQPVFADDGRVIFSILSTPHQAYLQAVSLDDGTYPIPLVLLPAAPKGITWLPNGFPEPLPNGFKPLSSLEGVFSPRGEIEQAVSQTPTRQRLRPLEGVKAPFPYIHEEAFEAFQALRQAVEERAGWDYLSRLENAYMPLSSPASPFFSEEWLYTGRAIALEPAAMNAGWLVVVKEEYGVEIYWRLYLKTRYQDGSQGMPLRELPFDLNARYSGDPMAYDQGGAWMTAAPSGYWIDLTELAQRYGWQRLSALSTWRTALNTARYSLLVQRNQMDWYSAMLELYPAEALYTATPVPSPTLTPTRTPFPTRTPTSTPTPSPSVTPRGTFTPSPSLIASMTP